MYNHTDSWKLLGGLCTNYTSIYPVYDLGKTIFEGLLYRMCYVYMSTLVYVLIYVLHTCTFCLPFPDPTEVSLLVDGATDQCSRGEDIDFELVGFSVFGQVCM